MPDSEDSESSDDGGAADELDASVGFALNARLLHAAALRDQGANVPMDPEWEAYLKEAQERGELNIDATREALRTMAGQLVRSQMMMEAAEGQGEPQVLQPAAPA